MSNKTSKQLQQTRTVCVRCTFKLYLLNIQNKLGKDVLLNAWCTVFSGGRSRSLLAREAGTGGAQHAFKAAAASAVARHQLARGGRSRRARLPVPLPVLLPLPRPPAGPRRRRRRRRGRGRHLAVRDGVAAPKPPKRFRSSRTATGRDAAVVATTKASLAPFPKRERAATATGAAAAAAAVAGRRNAAAAAIKTIRARA